MRRFIQVVFGVWLLTAIMLVTGLVTGYMVTDSQIIAFQSSLGPDKDIYIHDVVVGLTHNLTQQSQDSHSSRMMMSTEDVETMSSIHMQSLIYRGDDIAPDWSPDGKQIAFASYREGSLDIFVINLETGSLNNLTDRPGTDTSPVWSPDGKRIAFESIYTGQWGVSVINIETGIVQDLTDRAYASRAPAWSSDSTQIVFQSRSESSWSIYAINLETGVIRNLTNSASDDFNPRWSPQNS